MGRPRQLLRYARGRPRCLRALRVSRCEFFTTISTVIRPRPHPRSVSCSMSIAICLVSRVMRSAMASRSAMSSPATGSSSKSSSGSVASTRPSSSRRWSPYASASACSSARSRRPICSSTVPACSVTSNRSATTTPPARLVTVDGLGDDAVAYGAPRRVRVWNDRPRPDTPAVFWMIFHTEQRRLLTAIVRQ